MKTYKIKIHKTNRKVPVSRYVVGADISGTVTAGWTDWFAKPQPTTDLTKKPKGSVQDEVRQRVNLHITEAIKPPTVEHWDSVEPISKLNLSYPKPHKLGFFENLKNWRRR